jgi:DNA primase
LASYSQDFIEKVRDASNLVDIIAQYTELKPSGHQFMGRCPFPDHPEKTPSFSVSEPKQVYHCFGCKKSGNIFTFLESYSGMTFPDAVEYLARRANIPIPETPGVDPKKVAAQKSTKDLALRINQIAAQYFHDQLIKLPQNHPANQYRLSRGLTDEVAKEFQLGYATDSWDGLVGVLARAGLPAPLAEKLGLVKARTQGKSGYYDFFRDRLMFPIGSSTGDVIAFGGRALGDSQPKYLNSPETPLFHKGKSFYLLNQAVRHIRAEESVIVVEGYMDAIALHLAGFRNCVAVLGTALTKDHARHLKRHTQKVILLFDSDRAGQQAARSSLPVLLSEGLFVHGLVLEGGKDPDEFLKNPNATEHLKELLAHAPELFHIVMKDRLNTYNGSPSEKVSVLDDLADILTAMTDKRLKSLYATELAQRLQVTPSWVMNGLTPNARTAPNEVPKAAPGRGPQAPMAGRGPIPGQQASNPSSASNPIKPISNKIRVEKTARKVELVLLNLALKSRECMDEILLRDFVGQLSSHAAREILGRAAELYRHKPEDFDKLSALLAEQVEPVSAVTRHLEPEFAQATPSEDKKLLQDCIQNIHDFNLKRQAQALVEKLKQPSSDAELEQFMNVVLARKALKKETKEQ